MPWCPVCKNEYVDGVRICADCKVELVDELEERKEKPVTFGTEEEMQKLNDFLQYNQVQSGNIEFNEKEQIYEIFVSPEDRKQAKKLASIFMQEEALKNRQESEESEEPCKDNAEPLLYENKSDKAENFKTSAYTLILVGAVGAVVLVLSALKVFPFQFSILAYAVMSILFGLFLIMGILSFGSYKKIAREAVSENNLTREIKEWCTENLNADRVDEGLFTDEISEEMKYFKRAERMKKIISETYINLEDGFLDALVEEIYASIFEQTKVK